ncbi:MAG TPA: flagellar motor protein MotB [Terriglobales bacterium]|jgi:chemotaxis protein MotB
MKRAPSSHSHVNHERWLISYADFITLLFAFFVVMYAASRSDQMKAHALANAIQSAFAQMGMFTPASTTPHLTAPYMEAPTGQSAPGPPAPDAAILQDRQQLEALRLQLAAALAPEIARHTVELKLSHQGLLIRLRDFGFFPSGSDQVMPQSVPVLQRVAAALQPLHNPVRVEGYTDDVPIHTAQFSSNWQLSAARAAMLVQMFITSDGLAPERLSEAGYSQYHPIASNATAAGRGLNRRVDVVVVSLQAERAMAPAATPPMGPPAPPLASPVTPAPIQ